MGYDNNKFSIFDKFYSDGCGYKNDKKYYYNGTYIDLCGMSVEEYMKNQCCCGGGGGSDENAKPLNEIYVKSFKDDDGNIFYQAFSRFPVTSNIKINVSSTNDVLTVLDLYVGDTQTKPERGETEEFVTVTLNVDEDESYEYTIMTEQNNKIIDIYFNTMLLSESEFSKDSFQKITTENGSTIDMKFVIYGTDIDCNDMEIDELNEFCEKNQHCLIICIPKNIYDKGTYSVNTLGGDIITNKFVLTNTIIIDNVEYAYLKDTATDDIMPYVPLHNEDLVYEYKLTINK